MLACGTWIVKINTTISEYLNKQVKAVIANVAGMKGPRLYLSTSDDIHRPTVTLGETESKVG